MSALGESSAIQAAADAIRGADALLIGAGAGMGVDSGLPDFRGPEGFWKAYPPFRGKRFSDLSTPHWFETDPALAWGFFGHRLNLYRSATPHAGFGILLRWIRQKSLGGFVFTSNVDGQFQKAGFPENIVLECHGSIRHLQCTRSCGGIWSSDSVNMEVDATTIRATSAFPTCPACGAIARPNILMFGDAYWNSDRTDRQAAVYERWLNRVNGRNIVAIEMGAGLAIPTVRRQCEACATTLIRINPMEPDVPAGGISLRMGALEALQQIEAAGAERI